MDWLKIKYGRYGNSFWQFVRFGMVGGLGFFVNLATVFAVRKLLPLIWASAGIPAGDGVWWPIFNSEFNIRWYHVIYTVAFLVANVFNFQLNRWWTFRSNRAAGWFREYGPFLTVGLVALVITILGSTALMNEASPIALPRDVLDGSSGLRDPLYWTAIIMIVVNIPVSFLLNKFWTFRSVRGAPMAEAPKAPAAGLADDEAEA